ncbi:MAG: peptidylprolyl isomerase [Pseudohongiella sp.]|nr:peptidylprolyl isomerase [Pseudohongiella sp.]MDO9519567.1 peptidylprolyl isomerase [Pseudohongiella sp.]
MKKIMAIVLLKSCLVVSALIPGSAAYAQTLSALIETNRGNIEIELNDRGSPTSVANFANLSLRGFYDGLTFHRVENRFMVQGGDPLGNGTGNPGYRFQGETNLRHNRPGILSTANAGPGTDGSQFFITHVPTPHLDGMHSVFGVVTTGMQVVNQIRRGDRIIKITIIGDISALWDRKSEDLARWNSILDEGFPDLKPAPTPGMVGD